MGKKRWVNVELRQTLWNVESELRQLQDIEAQAPELMDEQRKGRRDELIKQLPKLRIQYGLCGGDGGIPDEGQAATEMRGWELLYIPDTPEEEKAIHGALSREPAPATPGTPAPAQDAGAQAIDPVAVVPDAIKGATAEAKTEANAAQTAPATAAATAKGLTIPEFLNQFSKQMGANAPNISELRRPFDGRAKQRQQYEIGRDPSDHGGKPRGVYPVEWFICDALPMLRKNGYSLPVDHQNELSEILQEMAHAPAMPI